MDWSCFLTGRWGVSFYIFAATLIILITLKIINHNTRKKIITSGRVTFGVFISAFVYFIPLYLEKGLNGFTAVLSSFQHSFRIFGLDGDFVEFVVNQKYPEDISELYIGYGALLYAIAPVLTFGFILTFFKNFYAHLKYKSLFWVETHVFSELNEKTLALANSIFENNRPLFGIIPRVLIVFMDIIDKKEELNLDLVEKAKRIDAILFRKDLESVHFKKDGSYRRIKFYLISEDESEKIRHSESIINQYDYTDVELFIFSEDIRTELILDKNKKANIKITRVNDIQALIYHNLDENGIKLFERARRTGEKEKVISVIIVGLGRYGKEMLKALTWYCQLEGYKLRINAFDADKKAKEKFVAQCPELMSDKYNKKFIKEGEPYYEIDIHSDMDVSVPEFENKLREITDATYIFVCLGDDETNLTAAARIGSLCERVEYVGDGCKPVIETVIYDSNVCKKLGVTWKDIEKRDEENRKKPNRNKGRYEYDILMIGDLENFYSEKTVINSELVKAGFEEHTYWSVEPAKVSFTQNRMADEWESFIKAEMLEESWKSYYCEWQEKNRKGKEEDEAPPELSDAIKDFSFMTAEEIRTAEKIAEKKKLKNKKDEKDEECLKKIRDAVIERSHKWDCEIYKKFKKLMETKKNADEWERKKAEKEAGEEKTYRIEYNYRSSIAKAIHKRLRKKLDFKPEITRKAWEDMTLKDKVELGKIEHIRWNAYTRTEGYSHAQKRNDLARVHHNLVPVEDLSNDDLRKDV